MNRQELKTLLLKMKKTNFEIPKSVDANDLTNNMVKCIGDIDPVFRDELILSCLWTLIERDDVSIKQQNVILKDLLSNEHLFLGLGEIEHDTVFNRTFSNLIIGVLVAKLENINYTLIVDRVLDYGHKELDLRGYVECKGWAHSTAHLADVLVSLAAHNKATAQSLKMMLELIHKKTTDNSFTYIYGEDERMARATEVIFNNKNLKEHEIASYIKKFKKIEGEYLDCCQGNFNAKNYLRSLYFRLRKINYDPQIVKVIYLVLTEEF
ncbi:DUF2785 domain-containing protein [Clostridium sp. 'deep sea']|uniref:DUF2785 domain-containing protein n=1 Tax=Clostridium sp. 'deep sea' TaxID=2779445 RepID=UPI0018966B50|nr:DUF2785 domain-containing protein [Clostridium sp. 'deep sea']QOR36246.1 DUF2785 domain-containing protein [Clostridium sp. 'deep sea']